MPDNTNIMPIIGIKKLFDENMLIDAINPPHEREPVSPINTLALFTLNNKNAKLPPLKQKDNNLKL